MAPCSSDFSETSRKRNASARIAPTDSLPVSAVNADVSSQHSHVYIVFFPFFRVLILSFQAESPSVQDASLTVSTVNPDLDDTLQSRQRATSGRKRKHPEEESASVASNVCIETYVFDSH